MNKKKKDIEIKVKEVRKPLFFRSISLDEVQLPSYQSQQLIDKKSTILRHASLFLSK